MSLLVLTLATFLLMLVPTSNLIMAEMALPEEDDENDEQQPVVMKL